MMRRSSTATLLCLLLVYTGSCRAQQAGDILLDTTNLNEASPSVPSPPASPAPDEDTTTVQGIYNPDPDCSGKNAHENPECGYWPFPKKSPKPGGSPTPGPGPSPPPRSPTPHSPSPHSPPPPDGCTTYTVAVNNLVADTDTCISVAERSISVNVKANVLTLPGVRPTTLRVGVDCIPGTRGSGARYRALISYCGTAEAKVWLDTAIPRVSPCCLWELLCPAFRSRTKGLQSLQDSKLCSTSKGSGCSGGGGGGNCPPASSPRPPSSPCPPAPKASPCPTKCPPATCPPTRRPPPPPPPQRASPSPSPTACPPCACASPPPPSPPPPPRPPPPPVWQKCADYLSTTGSNLVVWGDGRDPANAVWTVLPAGQGSCERDALVFRVYPVQAGCPQPTSLAIEVTGMVFMQCFTYDVLSSTPIVGPEVLIEPTGFNGELRLKQIQFDVVSSVEDCTRLLALNVVNSRGVSSTLELPCIPDNTQPYDFPGVGAVVYPNQKQRFFFSGMSNQHVLSIRRIYYEINFYS